MILKNALVLVVVCASLAACVSTDEVRAFRDDASQLRAQLERDEQRWAATVQRLDETDPLYPQAVAQLRRAESDRATAEAVIKQTESLLAESTNPTNPISALIGALAPWVPEPARVPLLLGGALAASIARARQLKTGLRSVAKSINKAIERDPEFAQRFAQHADMIRSTQTPAAMRVVDQVQRGRSPTTQTQQVERQV